MEFDFLVVSGDSQRLLTFALKKKLKRMCGTFKHQLPSYLDEFNWQRVYPGERFEMMLQHIAELYPVH